MILGR
jgi:hypothetical protein